MTKHATDIAEGKRFKFGANWTRFLRSLTDTQIKNAEHSLITALTDSNLKNKNFLDAGSGSGLFSLAAKKLGATVHSFDFDPQSVQCTRELQHRYFPNDSNWTIDTASVLDENYLESLPVYDIVYSWGVLHHTGSMWQALESCGRKVADGGKLFIAIYNDQGWVSSYWSAVKQMYVRHPVLRPFLALIHAPYLFAGRYVVRIISGRRQLERGMSLWHDMLDWIGGYPFEVARPEEIIDFYQQRGFRLLKLKTCAGRHGCNEYVFLRNQTNEPTGQ